MVIAFAAEAIILAVAAPLVTGFFAVIATIVSRRLDHEKEKATSQAAQVDASAHAVETMEAVMKRMEIELARRDGRIDELEKENERLRQGGQA